MTTFLAVLFGTLTAHLILIASVNYLEYKKRRYEITEWQRGKEELEKTFNRIMGEQKKEPRAEA